MNAAVLETLNGAFPGADPEVIRRAYEALTPYLKAPSKRAVKPPVGPVDTTTMDDAALFAHYKRTAPHGDLVFFADMLRRTGLSELHDAAIALYAAHFDASGAVRNRADFYRALRALQDKWRQATADYLPANKARAIRARVLGAIDASKAARMACKYAEPAGPIRWALPATVNPF